MQKITPFLWFDGNVSEAMKFYCSIFRKSKIVSVNRQELIAFNGGPHFKFTPAISLMVHCKDQREIDYYWTKLSKGGEESRCGWLTDKYGLSWQIIPDILRELLGDKNRAKAGRAMQAMLQMRKLDIKALRQAHAGR
jgi:predicted 3-demethylubiquinone-9 3-methyltransferase (glyoxalase superfamily)